MTTIAPPPPAPAGTPPLSPGGRTAFRVVLVVAAAVLVLGSVAALGVVSWGLSTVRVVTDSQNLPGAMRSLVVDTADIPVAVRITADREVREPRAELRLVNTSRAGEHRLDVATDAGGVRVGISGQPSPFLRWGRAGEITLVLPPELARRLSVTVQQETGVLMADADLDQLTARTTNGPILLRGAARRVDVQTRFGDVVARDPVSVTESFLARTVDGKVVVDFRDSAPADVEAVSRGGDVVIALPGNGPYLVRAQSGESTTVRVPETNDPADAVAEVTARSDDGDVVVEKLEVATPGRP